jgi:hypothetical protein
MSRETILKSASIKALEVIQSEPKKARIILYLNILDGSE